MHLLTIPTLFLALSILSFPLAALSQQGGAITFEASVDANEVFKDSYFQVTFTLRNAEGADFRPPDFKDFLVISGPSRGMSTTIINGEVRMEMSFSYVLQPRRTGQLRIGSAAVQGVANRVRRSYRSSPLTITVLEQKVARRGDSPDYFVRAALNVDEAYVGQQVRLDYTLYTAVEVQNYNMVEESSYLDFYAEDLSGADPQVKRTIVNGKEYYSQILKSLSLYPQKAGMLTIEPAALQLGVVKESGAESFFFGADVQRVGVSTEAVKLRVKPLPGNPPSSFSGAVGNFAFEASLDRNIATTDDALSLIVTITGDGDLKRVEAPAIEGLDSFEIYEPKVKEEFYGEESGKRIGRKVFEYLLAPRVPGHFDLTPAFSYFSPATGRYETLRGNNFKIEVRKGRSAAAGVQGGGNPAAGGGSGLMETDQLSRGGKRWLHRPEFWIALLLPLLVPGVIRGLSWYRESRGHSNVRSRPEEIRRTAEKWLEEAALHMQQGNSRLFYQAVSNAFLQYVAMRIPIPLSEQTQERILEELGRQGLGNPQVDTFRQILKNCELALYAGMDNSDAMGDTYQRALEMLEVLERFFQEKKKVGAL